LETQQHFENPEQSQDEEQQNREFQFQQPRKNRRYNRIRKSIPLSRLVVIHSCLLPNQYDPRILTLLLDEMIRFGLMKDSSAVIVLHYGEPLSEEFLAKYPDIFYVFVSEDISFFETPSLRTIQWLSQYLMETYFNDSASVYVSPSGNYHNQKSKKHRNKQFASQSTVPQLLYLHTKGISYANLYPQIEEWRNFAMHFMIEQHKANYHILQSGKYDVIGLTYHRNPRMLIGNYWWTRIDYLVNSPLPEIRFEKVNKYSAEKWILRSPYVRLYLPNFYDAILLPERFPRYCYASIDQDSKYIQGAHWNRNEDERQRYHFLTETMLSPLPSYQEWLKVCTNLSMTYYQHIHQLPYPLYDLKSKRRNEDILCIGMDLSSTLLPPDESFVV
jgi:hypothetical protein